MPEIELLQQAHQWDRLRDEWDSLAAASDDDNPFRRWLWMRTWWKQYGGGRTPAILTARDGKRLLGVAPLFREVASRPFRVRSLRFLGGTDVCSEYLGFLVRRESEHAVIPAFFDFLFDRWGDAWDVLRLSDIPADARQLELLRQCLRKRGIEGICTDGTTNQLVRFPESWEAYCGSLGSKRRTKLRRIVREFEQRDDVEFEMVQRPEQFDRCWQELRRLHQTRWSQAGESGCFADPRFDAFHSEVARALAERGELVLASLRVAGRPIACSYGIRQGETIYEYQRGHDPAWIPKRPGHALQLMQFRHLIGQDIRCWDYLRGDYRHKRDWSNDERRSVELTIPAARRSQVARLYLEQRYRTARRRLGGVRRWAAARLAAAKG